MTFAYGVLVASLVVFAAGLCLACGLVWGWQGVAGALMGLGVAGAVAGLLIDFEGRKP